MPKRTRKTTKQKQKHKKKTKNKQNENSNSNNNTYPYGQNNTNTNNNNNNNDDGGDDADLKHTNHQSNSNSNSNSNFQTQKAKSKAKSKSKSTQVKRNPQQNSMSVEDQLMSRPPRRWKVDPDKDFKFWKTQPVPRMKDKIGGDCNFAIDNKQLSEVRPTPLLLPSKFEWVELELGSEGPDSDLNEFYDVLANHYVEDDDNMFRFNYSCEFLRWAVCVPGYKKEWHLGVRVVKSGALVGCITAIPAQVSIYHKRVSMVEINFLCVHKKLRSNRLAPVLIKEITRRVNACNVWQAVYTAGVVIPKPIASNRYWHRSLNPKKLIEVGFSSIRKRMTLPRLTKLYKLAQHTSTPGLRVMTSNDCDAVHQLLTNYLKQFKLYVHFSLEDFHHCFLSRPSVVHSYVVEDETSHQITDFISFYALPSTILNNPKHTEMRAAYSYYHVCTHTGWTQLMNDCLILAKALNFDVFNALDVMQNSKFLKPLKFGIGDGHLQYYVYNWKCPEMQPNDVALVLL